MSAHPHSAAALEGERSVGRLSARSQQVIQALGSLGRPATDREIATRCGYGDMNAVRPRITELVQDGWLVESGEVVDRVTGKLVRLVTMASRMDWAAGVPLPPLPPPPRAPRRREVQLDLFPSHVGKGGRM